MKSVRLLRTKRKKSKLRGRQRGRRVMRSVGIRMRQFAMICDPMRQIATFCLGVRVLVLLQVRVRVRVRVQVLVRVQENRTRLRRVSPIHQKDYKPNQRTQNQPRLRCRVLYQTRTEKPKPRLTASRTRMGSTTGRTRNALTGCKSTRLSLPPRLQARLQKCLRKRPLNRVVSADGLTVPITRSVRTSAR